MELTAVLPNGRFDVRHRAHTQSIARKLLLALGMASAIGLAAQIRIYTPWSPVPITGQTLGVLLTGLVMGRNWGGMTLVIYIMLGLAGVPWFSPQAGMPLFTAGGAGHLLGPTGGYLLGFITAAMFIGHFSERRMFDNGVLKSLALMLFGSLVVVYVPGLIWLGVWTNTIGGAQAGWLAVISMGALPFVIGDIFKAALAALVSRAVSSGSAPN